MHPSTRRSLLKAAAALPLLSTASLLRAAEPDLSGLADMTAAARPIDAAERARRLSRAQALMKANGIGAVAIEPGSSMIYFTGVRWSRSERPTLAILPAEGQPLIVTPFFEEPSVRQTLAVPAEVRVWQEDEDATRIAAGWLREHRLDRGVLAIEETMRSFIATGLAAALPDARQVSANPVVRGCRMVKTPAEIALMRLATDVTLAAYRWTYARVEKGMTGAEIGALMNAATRKLGGAPEFALALIGPAAALPHGSREVVRVADGQAVLMDCGCTVQDYQSDVSRTWVHGEATKEQRTVWNHVAQGQQVAIRAARLGAPAGSVDDAVRAFYERLGYGPGYRLPGLSHRTGHGIGMDGHEPVNLVHGETTRLVQHATPLARRADLMGWSRERATPGPSERDKLLLSYAAETRRFEIERFWQRTLFFWTVLGAAFVAYAALADKDDRAQTAIACFGLVASLAWTLQNRGAKYWQEAWEQKTKRYQLAALGTDLFSRHEPRLRKGWFGGREFSVSRIAIILSDYTVMIWLLLAVRPLSPLAMSIARAVGPCSAGALARALDHVVEMTIAVSIAWCGVLLCFGRSSKTGGERADERHDDADR